MKFVFKVVVGCIVWRATYAVTDLLIDKYNHWKVKQILKD